MFRRRTRKMKGGELSAAVKQKIRDSYKIPNKMITEVGKLVDTEDQFFEQLAKAGLTYPKTNMPKVGESYVDEYMSQSKLNEEIEPNIYKGLYPFKSKFGTWIYSCAVCPDDDDSCELSEAIKTASMIDPTAEYDLMGLRKMLIETCKKKTGKISEIDDNISSLIEEYNTHFINYLYFLPWSVESNAMFYEKSLDFAIEFGFLSEGEVSDLKSSLSWQILGCQPCMVYEGNTKPFCIDPFYITESLEWVSNTYRMGEKWTSSEGLNLFKKRADPLIKEYNEKYGIDLTKKPAWWVPEFDTYEHDKYAVIIMYEQAVHREAFQKIQFLMTIIKLVLTNFVILNQAGNEILEKEKLLAPYMVSAQETRYGCAASIARSIESKMNKLIVLFNEEGFEKTLEAYKKIDPFVNGELKEDYVEKYTTFVDSFFGFIRKHAHSLIPIMKGIFDENLKSYKNMNTPLYLKSEDADKLGICSFKSGQLIEEVAATIMSGGRKKTRKGRARRNRRKTQKRK